MSSERKSDRIVYGEGIVPEDIEVFRSGNDMILTNRKTGETVTVQNAYYNSAGYYYLENVEFADGTVWGLKELTEKAVQRKGTDENDTVSGYVDSYGYRSAETFHMGAGNDTVRGGAGNDTIYGEEGNDYLYGDSGNDILYGGAGNDYMEGGAGDDTYLFGVNDGVDVIRDNCGSNIIRFLDHILAEDIRVGLSGNRDLELAIGDTQDRVILSDYFYSGAYRNFKVTFEDGTEASVDSTEMKLVYEKETETDVRTELKEEVDNGVAVLEQMTQAVENVSVTDKPEVMPSQDTAFNEAAEEEKKDAVEENCPDIAKEPPVSEESNTLEAMPEGSENTAVITVPEEEKPQETVLNETVDMLETVYSEEQNVMDGYSLDEATDIQVLQIVDAAASCPSENSVIEVSFSEDGPSQAVDTSELWAVNE